LPGQGWYEREPGGLPYKTSPCKMVNVDQAPTGAAESSSWREPWDSKPSHARAPDGAKERE